MNITTPDILQGSTPPPVGGASIFGRGIFSSSGMSATNSMTGGLGAAQATGADFAGLVRAQQGILKAQQAATTGVDTASATDADEKARYKKADEAATGLVSNALILPVLKQLRRSPWGGESVFSGGIGEKTFGPEFDMQLADHIAQSPRLGIKKALIDRMMKKSPKTAMSATKKTGLDVHG